MPENSEPGQLLSVLRLVDGLILSPSCVQALLQTIFLGSLPFEEQKPWKVALQANEVHAAKSIEAIELFQRPTMLL